MKNEVIKRLNEESDRFGINNDGFRKMKEYVEGLLDEPEALKKIGSSNKTLSDLYKAVREKAKGQATVGVACISSDLIFKWIREFYNLSAKPETSKSQTFGNKKSIFDMI